MLPWIWESASRRRLLRSARDLRPGHFPASLAPNADTVPWTLPPLNFVLGRLLSQERQDIGVSFGATPSRLPVTVNLAFDTAFFNQFDQVEAVLVQFALSQSSITPINFIVPTPQERLTCFDLIAVQNQPERSSDPVAELSELDPWLRRLLAEDQSSLPHGLSSHTAQISYLELENRTDTTIDMAEITYMGNEEEGLEVRKFNTAVLEDPDSLEAWENLVRSVQAQDGGVNRNSHPQHITDMRAVYDRFLARFPLLFGYWRKYADLEFSVAGMEAAELTWEKGIASIPNSVDLWTNYCSFKMDTCHDYQAIREGAQYVGLDFMAHPFWDKYIEFEERVEAPEKAFAIYQRVIHIPMHQYARYFEKYRPMLSSRPLAEIAEPDVLQELRSQVEQLGITSAQEIESEIRVRVDALNVEAYNKTQTETTKRWTYESKIARPYFTVAELDEEQLVNWRKYLEFEETDGNYARIVFLYERCLVPCAMYDEFWLRYTRWMSAQSGKTEELRHIYQRASCLYVPIGRLAIRLDWAYFEESQGRVDLAKDIHESILLVCPGNLEVILSLAHTARRHGGLEAGITVFKAYIESQSCDIYVKAALAAEWANMLWRIKGKPDEARAVFTKNSQYYLDSRYFWINWLKFEMAQPTSAQKEENQYKRIKAVADDIRKRAHLSPGTIRDLMHEYMTYLQERGAKDAMKEFLVLDREVNGPFVVQNDAKAKLAEDGMVATTERRMALENGHPGLEVDEAQIRKGHNIYNKYYQQQGEMPI